MESHLQSATGGSHDWSQDLIVRSNVDGSLSKDRIASARYDMPLPTLISAPVAQELGFSCLSNDTDERSNMNQSGIKEELSDTFVSSSMDMQTLDLLASARYHWTLGQQSSLTSTVALFREENLPCFGLGHPEGPTPTQGSFKSHWKARKEKLGERVAALQQLVAPFGKTDTASVLTEAIGYIKFLQDQIETLSVPYIDCRKKLRTADDEGSACKPADLRSRGLCLVPLSCTCYVTSESGDVCAMPHL